MNDLRLCLQEMLKDPDFALFWAFRDEWVSYLTAGSKILTGIELTDEEKLQLAQTLGNTEETKSVLQELIQKYSR